MIVLGLSGLPNAQPSHLRAHPEAVKIDRTICQGMDSAACLVIEGEVIAAVAEERFTGGKATGALHVAQKFTRMFTPYTGPSHPAVQVRESLERSANASRHNMTWDYHGYTADYLHMAAQHLAYDGIISWFSGRVEFGPRALGNRSILALPSGENIKDRLNIVVKLREGFRPFAPAILDTDYDEIFEGRPLQPSRYILLTARTRAEYLERVAGATRVDGSARVQIVTREDNEIIWGLLQRVKEHTGIGCVINTSFNVKNQPIIMTSGLAGEALASMSLIRLYIEGFRVSHAEKMAP